MRPDETVIAWKNFSGVDSMRKQLCAFLPSCLGMPIAVRVEFSDMAAHQHKSV
jgi:hypothetical protein